MRLEENLHHHDQLNDNLSILRVSNAIEQSVYIQCEIELVDGHFRDGGVLGQDLIGHFDAFRAAVLQRKRMDLNLKNSNWEERQFLNSDFRLPVYSKSYRRIVEEHDWDCRPPGDVAAETASDALEKSKEMHKSVKLRYGLRNTNQSINQSINLLANREKSNNESVKVRIQWRFTGIGVGVRFGQRWQRQNFQQQILHIRRWQTIDILVLALGRVHGREADVKVEGADDPAHPDLEHPIKDVRLRLHESGNAQEQFLL